MKALTRYSHLALVTQLRDLSAPIDNQALNRIG